MDKVVSRKVAHELLKINAIKFQPTDLFTWASGWKSPMYCDNRRALSFSDVRRVIRDSFVSLIKEIHPDVEVIAGVATGAIAHAALVADDLKLPFVYVRDKPKDHGLKLTIEGGTVSGKKVVIVEDHVSTGGSSLKVVENIQKESGDILGMVAIFTYEFPLAVENFAKTGCRLDTLSTYSILVEQAFEEGYIQKDDLAMLKRWHDDPASFTG
jgi:orotate phosphoribosyltransferase